MIAKDERNGPRRNDRLHLGSPPIGRTARTPSQRDRDRLIYTSALRRLAGVTQVVGPLEGHVFHNRLTHTQKVAQIARRLGEKLARRRRVAMDWGGIDPEVVEAAALAHDLGHPPFGHVAEHELDRLVKGAGDPEGYEGNAQSFRIVVKLASHKPEYDGLDLTRATLNAILKYPWPRLLSQVTHKRYKKFGYYSSETAAFDFARDGSKDGIQSVEAAIMDVADAIAYSVHDLDDFFRAGLVPLHMLRFSDAEFESFLEAWKGKLNEDDEIDANQLEDPGVKKSFRRLLEFWPTDHQYIGSQKQRKYLRWATSQLIDRFVQAVSLSPIGREVPVSVQPNEMLEMAFLQRLVRSYVIDNPRLATQQAGQRRIVAQLYCTYHRAIKRKDRHLLPPAFSESIASLPSEQSQRRIAEARLAADIVSSFSDNQAVVLSRRLSGVSPGSVMDFLEG